MARPAEARRAKILGHGVARGARDRASHRERREGAAQGPLPREARAVRSRHERFPFAAAAVASMCAARISSINASRFV